MRHSPFDSESDRDEATELRERLYAVLRQLERTQVNIPEIGPTPTSKRVVSIIKARRLRDRFFDPDLFADPAWDMLLELYAAQLEGVRTSVSSLSIGAAVPATTALRWMKTLERRGIIRRIPDPLDGRRIWVELTAEAGEAMAHLLQACPAGEPMI
ncbi:MAG: hypothetical protein ACJ8FS_01700 [Sphingomicrobium sp.]